MENHGFSPSPPRNARSGSSPGAVSEDRKELIMSLPDRAEFSDGRGEHPRSVIWLAACLAIAIGAAACASSGPRELPVTLRWPEAPDPSRIEYDSVISSARDIIGPRTLGQNFKAFIGLDAGTDIRKITHPADIEVTPDGSRVYVSDFAQGIVHIFDLAKSEVHYFGIPDPLRRPFGLALDSSGNLYVAEQEAQQIRLLSPNGKTLRFFRSDRMVRPVDIALDETRGRLYVADGSHQNSQEHYVRIFDLEGNYLGEVGEGRGSSEGHLLFPTYLTVDDAGNVYVADTMNSRISVFDVEGEFVRTIGARGDGFGLFDKPKGVALDSFGNIYVVDSSWSNVQIFGPEGHVLLYFGGRGGYPGLLKNPTGIAIARNTNKIFVGDYLNRRVAVYQLVNTGHGDGIPAESGETEEASTE
jgi:DNA-binding beta-propeller fold protein YncE